MKIQQQENSSQKSTNTTLTKSNQTLIEKQKELENQIIVFKSTIVSKN